MRMSQLSHDTGVPVATIKFYLREGLLSPGTRTAHNQAEYTETHVSRVRMIRTLTTVAQLSLSQVREVVAAVDTQGLSVRGLCHVVNRALSPAEAFATGMGGVEVAKDQVDNFIADLGWRVAADAPARTTLAQCLAALRALGWDCDVDVFAPLVEAAERLTTHQNDMAPGTPPVAVVARTVLFEVALTTIRRLVQEHYLTRAH